MIFTWMQIAERARRSPFQVQVRACDVPHPLDAGMKGGVDLPMGQRATFALALANGATLLVRDHGDHYIARFLPAPPRPLAAAEAALRETPGASIVAATAAGALVGAAVGQSKEAILVGALLGGVVGMVGVQVANAEASPQTSDAAKEAIDAMLRAARAASAAASTQTAATVAIATPPARRPAETRRLPGASNGRRTR